MRHQIVREALLDLSDGFPTNGTTIGPNAAGMKMVPKRSQTIVSALAGIMIAEAVEGDVPDRSETSDEQTLAKRDPDIVHGQIAHLEIRDGQIARTLLDIPDAVAVIGKTTE